MAAVTTKQSDTESADNRPPFLDPAVAILLGDVADRQILEIWGQTLDIHFPAFNRAGTGRVPVRFQP